MLLKLPGPHSWALFRFCTRVSLSSLSGSQTLQGTENSHVSTDVDTLVQCLLMIGDVGNVEAHWSQLIQPAVCAARAKTRQHFVNLSGSPSPVSDTVEEAQNIKQQSSKFQGVQLRQDWTGHVQECWPHLVGNFRWKSNLGQLNS